MNKLIISLSITCILTGCSGNTKSEHELPWHNKKYTWEALSERQVPQWFEDAKFGIMVCWGPYSLIDQRRSENNYAEWSPHHMYQSGKEFYYKYFEDTFGACPPEFGYKDLIPLFKAEKWNPDEWSDLFSKAGARYVTLVSEHHDGFALWDSDLTDWCATEKGPMRDIVGDLGIALRKRDIKYAPSYHRERHTSYFANEKYYVKSEPAKDVAKEIELVPEAAELYGPFELSDEFIADYVARWKEIEKKYRPDFMWIDDIPIFYWTDESENHPQVQKFRDAFLNMIGDYFKAADEWGKEVYLNNKGRNLNWPDGPGCLEMDNMRLDSIADKWQNPATMGTSYSYAKDEEINQSYKSPVELIHLLCDVVSKNGNLLLNIGPRADGTIPQSMQDRLLAIGEWLEQNGEAIYGTRPWQRYGQDEPELRFTSKPDALYVICFEKLSKTFTVADEDDMLVDKVKEITVLGTEASIKWEPVNKGIRIYPPEDYQGDYAWVYKIRIL